MKYVYLLQSLSVPTQRYVASPTTLRSASRHTTLVLLHTHPNTVLGRLLRISAFKTSGALRSLNDISKPGPDKPLRISAFGRFKVPMWVHLKSREPFGLAGLWDTWRKPDGKRVESFTIITTEPNELVRPVHNRMPVILRPEDEEQWLDAMDANATVAERRGDMPLSEPASLSA